MTVLEKSYEEETHMLDIAIPLHSSCFDGTFTKPKNMRWVDIIVMSGALWQSTYNSLLSLINDKNINDVNLHIYICNNWDNLKLLGWNQHELFLGVKGKRFLLDRFVGKENVNSPFYDVNI